MKNNKNKNISTIDLGNCEDILRNIYKINYSLPLLIYKVDYKNPNLLIPIIGYEVYHPLNYSKLNLSHCDNTTVSVSIPVSINEDKLYIYMTLIVIIIRIVVLLIPQITGQILL